MGQKSFYHFAIKINTVEQMTLFMAIVRWGPARLTAPPFLCTWWHPHYFCIKLVQKHSVFKCLLTETLTDCSFSSMHAPHLLGLHPTPTDLVQMHDLLKCTNHFLDTVKVFTKLNWTKHHSLKNTHSCIVLATLRFLTPPSGAAIQTSQSEWEITET